MQNSSYRHQEKIEEVLIREYGTICGQKNNKVLETKPEFTPNFYDSEEEEGIFWCHWLLIVYIIKSIFLVLNSIFSQNYFCFQT